MKAFINIRFKVLGTHRWPGADKKVEMLDYEHHHYFGFRCMIEVTELNREREFFLTSNEIQHYLKEMFVVDKNNGMMKFEGASCEHLAALLIEKFDYLHEVEVDEDGINSGLIRR